MQKENYNYLNLIGVVIMGLTLIATIYFGMQQRQETQPIKPNEQNIIINQNGNGTINTQTK